MNHPRFLVSDKSVVFRMYIYKSTISCGYGVVVNNNVNNNNVYASHGRVNKATEF